MVTFMFLLVALVSAFDFVTKVESKECGIEAMGVGERRWALRRSNRGGGI
jgi:hypothetical protein